MLHSVFTAIIAFFLVSTAPVLAQERTVNIAGGKRTLIASLGSYSTLGCQSAAVPEAKTVSAPTNGKLEFAMEPKVANVGRCGPITIYYRNVYYTPRSGYRGTDRVVVDFYSSVFAESSRQTSTRQSVNINIR